MHDIAVGLGLDAGMVAGYGRILNADVAVIAPADHQRLITQNVARPHRRAGWIDVDQNGMVHGGRLGPARYSSPGFDKVIHAGAIRRPYAVRAESASPTGVMACVRKVT